jgi:hypothetical protein
MILLSALIVALLIVGGYALGGWGLLALLYDAPALFCTLIPPAGYILISGYERFADGLSAVMHRPTKSRADVAAYFEKLALCTLAFGTSVPILAFIACQTFAAELKTDLHIVILTSAMYICFYSGWLALLLFLPISYSFSDGTSPSKLRPYFIIPALLGIGSFLCICASAVIVWTPIPIPMTAILQELANPCCGFLVWLWDAPSLLAVCCTLAACRLGMGKLPRRYDWIPIALVIGVLWSLQGMTMMLSDFDMNTLVPGMQVASITIIYACVFVLAVLVNRLGMFTTLGMVAAVFIVTAIALQMQQFFAQTPGVFVGIFNLIMSAIAVILGALWFGFALDYLYYFVVRFESYGKLPPKLQTYWIVSSCIVLIPLGLLFVFACVSILLMPCC